MSDEIDWKRAAQAANYAILRSAGFLSRSDTDALARAFIAQQELLKRAWDAKNDADWMRVRQILNEAIDATQT